MRIGRVLVCIVLALGQLWFLVPKAQALDTGTVVISQVQAGSVSSSRLVEIYNNTDHPIDITGWCVRYVSAGAALSYAPNSQRACFTTSDPAIHLILPERSYVLVGSSQVGIQADFVMTEGLGSGSSGKVYITDSQDNLVDTFGWGSETQYAEGVPKSSDENVSKVYERRQSASGMYIDSGNNSQDFFNSSLRSQYQIGLITEVTDVCQNLKEIHVLVPEGMILSGIDCIQDEVDLCLNIDGVQMTLPPDTEVDEVGICYKDVCINLPNFQEAIPDGFYADESGNCRYNLLPIQVTEVFPNPAGDDKNNEFIELYNPNNVEVDLTYHLFHLNNDFGKVYNFPVGLTIGPHSYLAVYDKDVSFTLTNTGTSLRLRTLDNAYVFDMPGYSDAGPGEAWALINGIWQYTVTPTPEAENEKPADGQNRVLSVLADCGVGRERNPLTNRCRNIVTAGNVTPCKEGQYRSEETNRCRNIVTASSKKPCKDNQYRSEETGRCRNIITASTRKPCKETQYRSEETGRCRNLPASHVPSADFAVQPTEGTAMAFAGWWAFGGIGLLATGYAGWEWRREVTSVIRKLYRR